jgi:hypothetical protein
VIKIPDRNTDEGLKTRVFMAECRDPEAPGYVLSDAKTCMQWMSLVLSNRVNNKPKQFMAKHATLLGVLTAPGQFQDFEGYPNYSAELVLRLQKMIDIANRPKDKRSGKYTDYIQTAMDVASADTVADPSPGLLAAWVTSGTRSPGPKFTLYGTSGGNDFYYIDDDE